MSPHHQRMAELADAADWYRRDQAIANDQLGQVAVQTPTSLLDWFHLYRIRAAIRRRVALTGYLAAQAETEHQILAQTLPETASAIEASEPDGLEFRVELLNDAINAESAALADADLAVKEAQCAHWPWQRTRAEMALLRGRYAEACARTHADAAHQARRGIDQLIRTRLPHT